MPGKQLGALLEFLRAALGARGPGDTMDADLLDRFTGQRDEEAFTTLLQRHGPLVLSVCRRVLGNAEDADDAFQATFLVLVRKAGSIRKSGSLASWLHGVALRVALEARTRAARRRALEKRAESTGSTDPSGDVAGRELRSILDEELEQLPPKYRAPLVLHYLAGKTKDETARQLGWSEGTVSGRLARARDLLRNRLTRRGVMLTGSALSAAVSQEATAASVSAVLEGSTLSLVSLFTAGELAAAASTTRVLDLTERVVRTMFLSKVKLATVVLLVATAFGLGAGGLIYWAQAQPPEGQKLHAPHPGVLGKDQPRPGEVKKPGVVFRAPGSFTLAVALTADGKLLARGGADHTVDLWEVASGKKLHTLKGHTVPILRVAFSPDGKTLASITGTWLPDDVPTEVKLWDVATGEERVALQGHPSRGLALAFAPDGKTLATSSNTVKLWDVATGKEKLELKLRKGALPWSLAFAPDGKTLATGSGGGVMDVTPSSVILWDVATGKEKTTLPGHGNSITWVGFAPNGKTLASASGASRVIVEDNKDLPPKFLPGQLKLWDVATAKERITVPIRTATPLQFFDLVFTADGRTLISATASFGEMPGEGGLAVQHWEVASGKVRSTFWAPINAGGPPGAGTNAGVFFAALSADGKTVAWGGAEKREEKVTGTAEVWEVQSLATAPPKLPKEIQLP
jgi:RNA polymerase sigma factor (sigma-70 family)